MSPADSAMAETSARLRTRRAILDAAVVALAQNPTAPLADIAVVAKVGRTTVHRYFPERSDLLRAMSLDALDRIASATERARLSEGDAPGALGRLCQEFFELGDLFTLFFTLPELVAAPEWEEETESDRALLATVERGHGEGTVDPGMSPRWVQQLVWSLLFSAWTHVRENGAPKHESLAVCLRSLAKVLAP